MSDPSRLVVGLPYKKKHGDVPMGDTLKDLKYELETTKSAIARFTEKLSTLRTSGVQVRAHIERLKEMQKEDEKAIAGYKKERFGVFAKEPFAWIPAGFETDDEEGYGSGLTGIVIFETWEEAVEMTQRLNGRWRRRRSASSKPSVSNQRSTSSGSNRRCLVEDGVIHTSHY